MSTGVRWSASVGIGTLSRATTRVSVTAVVPGTSERERKRGKRSQYQCVEKVESGIEGPVLYSPFEMPETHEIDQTRL